MARRRTAYPQIRRRLLGPHIVKIFRDQADRYGSRLAVEKRSLGIWKGWSWQEYYETARRIGLGLYHLGIRSKDRVALCSENRLEWIAADMGIMGIGACTVPIYPSITAEEMIFITGQSESKILILENQIALDRIFKNRSRCPHLEKIILIESSEEISNPDVILSFEDLKRLGGRYADTGLFETSGDQINSEDIATLVYTSGTTGPPKGVMITHNNILSVFEALDAVVPAYETDVTVPFLPLSHVFERIAGHLYGLKVGITAHYTENFNTLMEDIQTKKPTVILSVPRFLEKVYARMLTKIHEQPSWKREVFNWAWNMEKDADVLKNQKK
ncbi:MAG: AMP-binding protein, partial [Thermodesulfobacteriota bacterium]